jgi:hypothetical protein
MMTELGLVLATIDTSYRPRLFSDYSSAFSRNVSVSLQSAVVEWYCRECGPVYVLLAEFSR